MIHKFLTLAIAFVASTTLFAAEQSGKIGPNATWHFANGVFSISGSGETYDGSYSYNGMYIAIPGRGNQNKVVEAEFKANSEEPYGVITFKYGAELKGDKYTFKPEQVTSIVIGEGITKLGEWTCAFFTNAQSIQIPSTLTNLGGGAFLNNTALTQVTIPSNVDTMKVATCKSEASMYGSNIPMGAFHGCTNLKTVYWNARGNTEDNIVQPLEGLENVLTKIVLGESVVHIPEKICMDFTKITGELRIERNIKTIGYAAFAGCSNINKITLLADSMATQPTLFWSSYYYSSIFTNYHGAPFAMCSKNMEIFIGKNVKYIGAYMFSNYIEKGKSVAGNTATYEIYKNNYVDSLRVTFEEGSTLKTIDSYAFAGVKGLDKFSLPSTIEEIMPNAFYDTDLTSVTIPKNLIRIGVEAFASCPSLTTIHYNAKNAYVTTYGTYKNNGWEYVFASPFLKDADSLAIIIGKDVNYIPSYMFMAGQCTRKYKDSWTSSVSISSRSDIKKIIIEEGSNLRTIDAYSFSGCEGIKTMTIPENVYDIGDSAFLKCTAIDTFYVLNNSPAYLGKLAFPSDAKIKVNCVARDNYLNNNNWNIYNVVTECSGPLPTYTIDFLLSYDNMIILQSVQVSAGEIPVYTGPNPTIEPTMQYEYTFKEWFSYDTNGNITYGIQPAFEDKAYFADYNEILRKYTVTFVDWDESIIDTQEVEYGGSAISPEAPIRDGYTFTGWDIDFSYVQSDLTIRAKYTKNAPEPVYFTVYFYDWDDTLLKKQTVEQGHDATPPDDPVREGYEFTGWDEDYTNIQHNLTIYARYKKLDQALDEINAYDSPTKILHNNQIFILRGDKVYTLDGRLVR
jgi:hypothetical protein